MDVISHLKISSKASVTLALFPLIFVLHINCMRVEGLLDKDKSNCFSFVISILLLYYSGAMLLDCFYKHKKIQVHVKLFQFHKMHLFIIEQYPLHYDIHKNNIMFMRKLE